MNAKNNDGVTALMWATKGGHTEIVEFLERAEAGE
jgi:ankyrin repeat protein